MILLLNNLSVGSKFFFICHTSVIDTFTIFASIERRNDDGDRKHELFIDIYVELVKIIHGLFLQR